MTQRIVIDPVTRIEGHLRIEAVLNSETHSLTEAYSSGTMIRGLEVILQGRDPRTAWALAQRICGVCTFIHGLASVRAVENALHYPIPPNAQLIRNLMHAAQYLHDHVMHFYHLHAMDWVDVLSALEADPNKTSEFARSRSRYPYTDASYFAEVQKKFKNFVTSGQLGIFAQGYWGHRAYQLPAEVNLLILAHYLDALAWQREIVKLHTIFGGKNPHPNLVVGGMPCAIDLNSDLALNRQKLSQVSTCIDLMRDFVTEVYIPDVIAIASFYKNWGSLGEGLGNFMTYNEFPLNGVDDGAHYLIPAGVILERDLSAIQNLDLQAVDQIQEDITHSWYAYQQGKTARLHPSVGETTLDYTGPQPPYSQLDTDKAYSWIKSPRWQGHAVEVGPLARLLMLYARGHEQMKALVESTLKTLNLPLENLFSTLGRTLARALETQIIADAMPNWYTRLVTAIDNGDTQTFNPQFWEPTSWPTSAQGVGWVEAPRGGLAHWITIEKGKISNYQAVVPTTWNAGPRDNQGQPGAYEAALVGHPLVNTEQPLEILRTIHSFDPCIACAVHLLTEHTEV